MPAPDFHLHTAVSESSLGSSKLQERWILRSQHKRIEILLDDHVLHTLHRLVQHCRIGGIGVVDIGLLVR